MEKKPKIKKVKRFKITGNMEEVITNSILTWSEEEKFDREKYFMFLENTIKEILSREEKEELTYDILDTEKSKKNKIVVLKEKQRQMKVGEIWQKAIGNYDGYIDLGIGHESGLDILSHKKKVIIELKNRTNTDNASSKTSNLNKLARFKKANPEYTCVYANINDNTIKKTIEGSLKKIFHEDIEIEHQIGMTFLRYVFGDDVELIVEFIKNTIDKYT